MKQLQQSVRTGLVSVVEVPTPRVGEGQVLVHVGASVISAGTERMVTEFASKNLLDKARARPDLVRQVVDKARREGVLTTMDAVRSRLDQPLPLGYSCAGTVLEVGRSVAGFQVGDRVACAGGGYATHAEIVAVPHQLVGKLPAPEPGGGQGTDGESTSRSSLEFEEAAFTTLGAVALQGIRLADPKLGETVAVIGLGLLGLLTVQLLKAAGCTVIGIDLQPNRAALARQLGVDATATDTEAFIALVQQLSSGHGADAVLITADTPSSQPVELAGAIARDRGVVVAVGAVGLVVPRKVYYEKELDFRVSRSYGPGRYDAEYEEKGHDYPIGFVRWTEGRNMQAFVQLLAERKVSVAPLITHRFPIDDAAQAYDLVTGKTGVPFLGVVITYPEAPNRAARVELQGGRGDSETGTATTRREPASAVHVGLLGAGNFAGLTLLPAMKQVEGIELSGVCTATGLSARHAGDRFGFGFCTTNEQELYAHPSINTVVIATRHHLHARQVMAALEAGKHVFCEKPLALNEDELATIVDRYRTLGSQLLVVGYNRRFAPMAQQLKAFVDQAHEPLVMHYRVNAGYIPPEHWVHDPDQGGGRILGEVCHFVDFLTFLTGGAPIRVEARSLPNRGRYREDNVVITLQFANGSLGAITYVANGDKAFSKERVEVFGGGSAAVLDDFRRLELVRDGRKRGATARLRQDKGHRGQWEAFVSALQQAGPPPIPFGDILATSVATFRILDSLRDGQPMAVDVTAWGAEPVAAS